LTPEFALEISKFQNSEYEVHQISPVALKTAEISSIQISTNDRTATPATPFDRRNYFFRSKLIFTFHIWNMESIGFTRNFFYYCKFSRLRTFYTEKTKKNPSVTRRCRPCRGFLDEIWGAASSAVLNARKLKFWLKASF
jgi:hypothetical protein